MVATVENMDTMEWIGTAPNGTVETVDVSVVDTHDNENKSFPYIIVDKPKPVPTITIDFK